MSYWDVYRLNNVQLHTIPTDDMRPHVVSVRCWCDPYEDYNSDDCWIHNSLDQRELYEQGIRKVS